MHNLNRFSINGVGGPYTAAQVLAQLIIPVRAEQWRFDRLSAAGRYVGDLTPFVDKATNIPQVDHDTTKDVKRSLQITLRGDSGLVSLSDLVRAVYLLPMPDGGVVQFSLGTFTFMPNEDDVFPGVTWRQLQMTDPGQLLVDGTFLSTYTVAQGTSYVAAIRGIIANLGSPTPLQVSIIPDSGQVLPAALSWDAGTSRLKAVNDLLEAVNYYPAWWNDLVLTSSPIPDYSTVTTTVTMDATQVGSPIRLPHRRKPDMTKVFNQALVRVEDPRKTPPTYGFYQNINPASPVSVKAWHAKTFTETNPKMADTATADARAKFLVQMAAMMYQPAEVDTIAWPISQDNDVYRIIYSSPDDGKQNNLFLETRWTMKCAPGEITTHELTQITPVA